MKCPSVVCLLAAPVLLAGSALAQDAAQSPSSAAGKPADLCQELVAFVKQPEPAKQAAATPPQQSTAVSNPSGKTESSPSSAAGEVQKKSGLSGPTDSRGPEGVSPNPELVKANAAAKVAPAPAAPAPALRPDAAMVEKVEAAAAANDWTACRTAARAMRVSGVAMPPALLALAALDPSLATR